MKKLKCKICNSLAELFEDFNFENYLVTLDQGSETDEYPLCGKCFRKIETILNKKI
jgi:hypothetical protein